MAIELLPPQLANQIAAGEVVERPASVVKELVENSLDAGASKVEIDIERGGSKLIRIRDNGNGIVKEDLSLALSRHATSKVHTLDDLEAILSFGFRGEALASVSSVSRLSLTSRTAEQTEAWQAYAEGSQMAVKVVPAAHPVGTTIEVADLFFNTPARRRFLKSDKTEFTHIDEWLKRIALARTDIHFILSHNGKRIRQYRPANTNIQLQQRIGQVCGKSFAEQALSVSCEHDGLELSGYLQSPFDSVYSGVHYFYVNGRLVRDRLVNHAVKQAFNEFGFEIQPSYVLKLTLDPHQVDVNVHPAKHEVRFHQARYVHDYILQALQSVLAQVNHQEQQPLIAEHGLHSEATKANYAGPGSSQADVSHSSVSQNVFSQSEVRNDSADPSIQSRDDAVVSSGGFNSHSQYGRMRIPDGSSSGYTQQTSQPVDSNHTAAAGSQNTDVSGGAGKTGYQYGQPQAVSKTAIASYGQLLSTTSAQSNSSYVEEQPLNSTGLSQSTVNMPNVLDGQYWVMVKQNSLSLLAISKVATVTIKSEILAKLSNGLVGQPLLMPVSIKADSDWQALIEQRSILLKKLGIELAIRYQQLIIKKVPQYIRDTHLASVMPELLQWIALEEPSDEAIAHWIAPLASEKFESAQTIWQKYCQLDNDTQLQLVQSAIHIPWQNWIQEQTCEQQQ
ncbi:DNA mismatch repair endonuclease MutL [Shewanella maritima]|uniref:DNA mismatch repair endonuclease MutL n=1 Tax=Shewanella maritima TaxID=2520507 RepID=UPI003736F621